eukprot:4552494-Pyramimonas_sp.AAC.1
MLKLYHIIPLCIVCSVVGTLCSAASADGIDEVGFGVAVHDIADESFATSTIGPTLIMYYAEWSGSCKRLAPIWTQLAEQHHGSGSKLVVGKLLATEHRDNPGSAFVTFFPTLLYVVGGKVIDVYRGEYDIYALQQYADGMLQLGDEAKSPQVKKHMGRFKAEWKKQ